MGKIHKLSEDVIVKVAAGEVIENPASIVKELVDNSLDAGSSRIEISLEKAGLKSISVVDNGVGMSKEDLDICTQHHTTSKISEVSDLSFVKTLGFRGEALSSIASVSKLTLKSRSVDSFGGWEICLDDYPHFKSREVGMNTGTSITVEKLFHNIPARKKFLKSEILELRKVLEVITSFALSFPHVGFIFRHNGKTLFDLSENSDLATRISKLFGVEFFEKLIPVFSETSNLKLHGYISRPQLNYAHRTNFFTFVNSRLINNRALTSVIKESYGSLLDPRSYPAVFLFLQMPSDLLDVNVHPTKQDVAFWNVSQVHSFVEDSIKETLKKANLLYEQGSISKDPAYKTVSGILKNAEDLWLVKDAFKGNEILQIANLYLVAQTKRGLLLLDQHAAHEKILYNQLYDIFQTKKRESLPLTTPLILDLSLSDAILLNSNLDFFSDLGFEIEEFGGNSFKISSLPVVFPKDESSVLKFIEEFLGDIASETTTKDIDQKSRKIIAYLSCRLAIKGGEFLTENERERLVKRVLDTDTIYTCPHGRPAMVHISLAEIGRLFKRL